MVRAATVTVAVTKQKGVRLWERHYYSPFGPVSGPIGTYSQRSCGPQVTADQKEICGGFITYAAAEILRQQRKPRPKRGLRNVSPFGDGHCSLIPCIPEVNMFRMYTENTPETVSAVVSSPVTLSGCTVMEAVGWWKGKPEKSLIVEVTDPQESEIRQLARRIIEKCGQESVLLVHLNNQAEFITA